MLGTLIDYWDSLPALSPTSISGRLAQPFLLPQDLWFLDVLGVPKVAFMSSPIRG